MAKGPKKDTKKTAKESYEDRLTWRMGDLVVIYDPREAELTFCLWDGEPSLYRLGEAWVFRNNTWLNAPSMDVAMQAVVLSEGSFKSMFPSLPPLPNNAFRQVTQPPPPAKK
jgi:hypothetical protein